MTSDNAPVTADDLPLPVGTRLLHIGPQKTGTSGLQAAFHAARRRVEAQGVHYAGANRQPRKAAIAAASGEESSRAEDRGARGKHWRALLRDVRGSTAARLLISSEAFGEAEPGAIREIVDALDPRRVHVVVTLRPLDRILPSQWQQAVQGGTTIPYEVWLANVLDRPSSGDAKAFWHRHRHHELVARWVAVVGGSNVTAVVVDDGRPEAALRAFERLLELAEGTLAPVAEGANRSLTRSEVELVRAAHTVFRDADVSTRIRLDVVTRGMAAGVKGRHPDHGEPRVVTPEGLRDRVRAASREIVDGLGASGVRIIGDIESLAAEPVARAAGDAAAGLEAWPAIQERALVGVLHQTGLTRGAARPAPDLADWSTSRLASHMVGRLKGLVRDA